MRLIDADELKKAMRKAKRGHYAAFSDVTLQDIFRVIDNAPTVTGLISAKDFKKRINNMEYVYLQDCAADVLDAIDCEVTYFKEKMRGCAE